MSTANSVLEVGVHIAEKFTSNAGEHIVDGFFQPQDSNFDICSDLARRDPNDHIHEEVENDSGVDLFAWKRKRPTICKSILRCSFIVFLVVLLTGSYFGIVGNLLIFVILKTMLNYNYFCDWIKENTLNTEPIYNMRMSFVLVREIFLDSFLVLILCTVFTWSAVKRSRILVVNALFVITNISCYVILYVNHTQGIAFLSYPLNILYTITMFHHSYTMGRKLCPQSRTAALKVATKLCVHLAATVITSYIMHYAMFPWYLTLHGVPKLLVATVAPLIFLPSKLLGRLCVLRLQGVIHPSTSFALVTVIYAIESAMARAMQADMTGFKMFVIYGVIHGAVNVLESLVITTEDRWSEMMSRFCSRMKRSAIYQERLIARNAKHRSPRAQRLVADMSLQTMLLESMAIVLTTGYFHMFEIVYQPLLSPEKGAAIITKLLMYIFTALFTEFFFHSLSVLLLSRYMNVPVVRVWEARWRLHLWVATCTTLFSIVYLTPHFLPIVAEKYKTEGPGVKDDTCNQR